jgi:hypothetical protein
MIIQLPPYTQAQYDNIDCVATCSIDSPNSPYQMHVMSVQVCYSDLVNRPIVDAYLSYDSTLPTTYSLHLTVTNYTSIHINSKHLLLLNFIMQSIISDTDVTLDSIKSNFPELLI